MLTRLYRYSWTLGLIACLILSGLLISGCEDVDIEAEMAALDRALIPALMITQKDDRTGKAVMSVNRLKFQWSLFKARTGISLEGDGGSVEEVIMQADSMVNSGRVLEAHRKLEEVRGILYSARKRSGMDYFPDRLVEFHEAMELLLKATERHDTQAATARLAEAKDKWLVVDKAKIRREPYRMSKDQVKGLKSIIKDETEALDALEQALAANDAALIAKHSAEVKKRFISVYRVFGDFSAAGF